MLVTLFLNNEGIINIRRKSKGERRAEKEKEH